MGSRRSMIPTCSGRAMHSRPRRLLRAKPRGEIPIVGELFRRFVHVDMRDVFSHLKPFFARFAGLVGVWVFHLMMFQVRATMRWVVDLYSRLCNCRNMVFLFIISFLLINYLRRIFVILVYSLLQLPTHTPRCVTCMQILCILLRVLLLGVIFQLLGIFLI